MEHTSFKVLAKNAPVEMLQDWRKPDKYWIFTVVQIIPIRSRQTYSKQVCLWDLAQIICITFIIQIVSAI